MSRELNPTQAFWLGHLSYAAALQMPLSAYANTQTVTLVDLMAWEKRLSVQGFPVPPRCRPARFVAVEVIA
ncbi:hypothetical protein [Halomonas dongshanensis]|uniref:Uncharacterized protein n=1 Tax=Halomonas dongshanensis TaxID=2890835 RepID=A0ABT2EAD2_9GAMM|nr:hypothetical protein [Halomonas dongshanensis]MCS2608484.1 hypothetical protein [Halomonas dongshanensis]